MKLATLVTPTSPENYFNESKVSGQQAGVEYGTQEDHNTLKRRNYKKLWEEKLEEIDAEQRRKHPGRIIDHDAQEYQKYYFELDGLVEDMHAKVHNIITNQEMSFLEGYKNHMLHINRELTKYKKKIDEKEFENRRDEKIVSLQNNLEWFKKEALSLHAINLKHKEEIFLLKQQNILLAEEKSIAEQTAERIRERTIQLVKALKVASHNESNLMK